MTNGSPLVLSTLGVEYEVIFVNDASVDDSLRLLTEDTNRNRHLTIVTMSRRFGLAECAVAGLAFYDDVRGGPRYIIDSIVGGKAASPAPSRPAVR